MNSSFPRTGLPGAIGLHLLLTVCVLADDRPSCAELARTVQRDVSARPERVLIIVEDALVVQDTCSCEVTKAAIVASKAKPKLVGQIVFTAITVSPKNASLIAECAAATSPDASNEIKSAVAKALGGTPATATAATASDTAPGDSAAAATSAPTPTPGKNPATDKNPPPAPTPPAPDFGPSPVTIGGVYLVYPGGGGSPVVVEKERIQTIRVTSRKPRVIVIQPPTATSSIEAPPE